MNLRLIDVNEKKSKWCKYEIGEKYRLGDFIY